MTNTDMLVIGVAYATLAKKLWLRVEVPQGATVLDAVKASGILEEYTDIDLETQKVGIFGRFVPIEEPLKTGDRVEIYRPITADPQQVKRKKVKKKKIARDA